MRENHNFCLQKSLSHSSFEPDLHYENDLPFQSLCYIFPNDLETCKKYKSFKTMLQFNQTEMLEYYTQRLSMLNRSTYTIKVKQIMREDYSQYKQNKARLLLYYEPMPFSMEFARNGAAGDSLLTSDLERMLNEAINELIYFDIYYEVTVQNCGFSEYGEFRIFVPPSLAIKEEKLSMAERKVMFDSGKQIIQFWKNEGMKAINKIANRQSNRFNSPVLEKEQFRLPRNSDEEAIDVKKTIKLTKAYVKELCVKIEENNKNESNQPELKKHKSMELIIKPEEKLKEKKSCHFVDKIQQINKKMDAIRLQYVKNNRMGQSGPNKNEPLRFTHQYRSKQTEKVDNYHLESHKYHQEIIFDQQEQLNPRPTQRINNYILDPVLQDDCESVDTYMKELGGHFQMPSFKPPCQMRRTALPTVMGRANDSNWHHESAGNGLFKRFIQKNIEICPQLFEEKQERKISMGAVIKKQMKHGCAKEVHSGKKNESRLKKMISLDLLESKLQTNSNHLSQEDESNLRRRRQKEARNQQIKDKVQHILIKSKKAIELLKNPFKIAQ